MNDTSTSTFRLTLKLADFGLLDQGWLAVDGMLPYGDPCPCGEGEHGPPADLSALVGKACEKCDGVEWALVGTPFRCPDCHGTGVELLTVTTGHVRPPTLSMELAGESECDGCGIRSVRVRLTGPAVPVVGFGATLPSYPVIEVWPDGSARLHRGDAEYVLVSLGPNPERLIGRYLYPVARPT